MSEAATPQNKRSSPRALVLSTEIVGSLMVALTAAVFSVSFAVIIFGDGPAENLSLGITFTLLGSAAALLVTGIFGSLKGAMSHCQDAPMLLAAAAVTQMLIVHNAMPPDQAFATTVALILTTTSVTGMFIYLAGLLRLSFAARFMPYPVISGLLASIGYLLTIGSLGLVLQRHVDVYAMPSIVADGSVLQWLPWGLGAALMVLGKKWLTPNRVLPIGLVSGFALFHIWLTLSGNSVMDASANGLLLGPFPDAGSSARLALTLMPQANTGAVLQFLPVVAAIVPLAIITGILNIQAIAQVSDREHDLDQDMRAMGIANMTSGMFGGLVSYPAVSTSVLGLHLGVRAALGWGVATVACVALALFGTDVLAVLPRGLFAMIVMYLGLSLLLDAALDDTRKLPLRDLIPMMAIFFTTVFIGLMPALVVGILASVAVFLISYARLPFLRSDTTLAYRRSIMERAEPNHQLLQEEGKNVRILELTGSLFFGTAYALRQHVGDILRQEKHTHTLVFDFRAVRDADASAISSLERMIANCGTHGLAVAFSGLRPSMLRRMRRFGMLTDDLMLDDGVEIFESLDDALRHLEDRLLAMRTERGEETGPRKTFLTELQQSAPDLDLTKVFPILDVKDGQEIISQGDPSNEIFILLDGGAAAIVETANAMPLVVARFEPGALIGEIAYYQQSTRTATVVAEGAAKLMKIEPDRLIAGSDLPETLVTAFHRISARHLSQRLAVATRLLRNTMN